MNDDTATAATEIRADAALTAHTAGRMLDAALTLGDIARPLVSGLDIDPLAYGRLSLAGQLCRAHQASLADAMGTLDRLGHVLAGDADRLYQVAFSVREAERATGQRMRRGGDR